MKAAIVCDDKELEMYDVRQDGASSLTAFVASQAGKQFKITFTSNIEFTINLHVDGQLVHHVYVPAGERGVFLGLANSMHSILPFKFQELQLVDSDLEDSPIVPEVGTIELKAYRCQKRRDVRSPSASLHMHEDLHRGRVSERSKKAGWHHVAFGDEIPAGRLHRVKVDRLDSPNGPPYASMKIFYRPRELLRAQGIIPGNDVGRQGSPINGKKRAREEGSPGPSRSRPKIKVKREEFPGDARAQQIRTLQAGLQAELDALEAAEQSGTSVKRELRSPSPIVVRHAGEVVDLTLDD